MACCGFNRSSGLGALLGAMLILVCVFTASGRACAANGRTIADVQCIVVGARLSESADQKQRLSGKILLTYFFGAHRRSVSECRSGNDDRARSAEDDHFGLLEGGA